MLSGCAGAPAGGGNDNGNGGGGGGGGNVPADAEPIGDVGGFFDADRAWAIIAPSVFVGGFGTHVEFVSISLGAGEPICLGREPQATVAFDGEKFQILTTFAGTELFDSCRLQITGDAAACAPNPIGFAPSPCDLGNVEADITIDGESAEVDSPQIVRFSRCDPLLLSSRNEWLITSEHPLALITIQDPAAVGAVFALGGELDQIVGASLYTGLDGQTVVGCEDETVDNDVLSYDLEHLSIDVVMNEGDCTTIFEGDHVYCALINPADLGQPVGQSTAIVRVEGSGEYTHADGQGDFDLMYLSYLSGPGGGGGCGNVRCKVRFAK